MKKYIDYMNEITPDMLFEGLLGHGLFSDALPKIFTSEQFMKFYTTQQCPLKNGWYKWVNVEIMRNTNVPRVFGIPNPFAYYFLCKLLQEKWEDIRKHFSRTTSKYNYRVSRIHIKSMKDSPKLFKMNYQNRHYDDAPEDNIRIGAKYIVKADISSCFPSIYTHAIPWAVLGKKEAKKKLKDEWSNALDKRVSKMKNGETHGLHIGPHTSNLISEIILTCVDNQLLTGEDNKSSKWKYVRYIDDYRCYVASYEEGERFIASLTKELENYGLSINHKKTQIEKLPQGEDEPWINKLIRAKLSWLPSSKSTENHDVETKTTIGYEDVKQYILFAIENGIDDSAAINYAVKVLRENYIMLDSAKEYFYKKMLHLAEIYPYLLRLLDEYVFDLTSEKEYKEQLSNRIFKDSIATHKYEEAYYAMLFAIKYDFTIEMNDFDYDKIVDSNDCLLLLISWLYFNKYNNEAMKQKLKDKAKTFGEDEFDEYWLFAYECLSENELPVKPADKKLAEGSYADEWKKLKRHKVSFIKDEWRKLCII